jgi:hypothetical protein
MPLIGQVYRTEGYSDSGETAWKCYGICRMLQ